MGSPLATKPRRVAAKQFAAPLPHEDAEVVGRLLEADLSCTIVDQRDLEVRVKITGIETYPVWGGERYYLFVVVDTDEGVYGVGEAGLTGRELAVTGAIEHFEPLLVGEDPFRTEHLWQLHFRGGFFPARHAVSAAISAVDFDSGSKTARFESLATTVPLCSLTRVNSPPIQMSRFRPVRSLVRSR